MPPDLVPTGLRCEYLTDPLGIDDAAPRLSWTLESPHRGQRQTAFQILVAGDEVRLTRGEGDLWDSGKIPDGRSVHVVYAGARLRSGQRCWWAVRVWDGNGEVSGFSEAAWWEMGLLRPDEWRAQWIGQVLPANVEHAPPSPATNFPPGTRRPLAELDLEPCPHLRISFELPAGVRRARLFATARGVYELRLNGRRVGDALLAPGWTDYRTRILYQTYDVAGLLRSGENALGAILGDGWYSGYIGWHGQNKHYGDRPQLLLQLVVELDDGSTRTIVSDDEWRATTGPLRYSDLLMGERYDARAELPGWDSPGYDDGAWQPVAVRPRDDVALVADRAEPVRVTAELAPVRIDRLDDGTTIVDMGQNMVGWVRLRATGPAGTEIRLRFGEALNPAGTLYTENLRSAHQTDTYLLHGDGPETYEPRFAVHGFRYVEITGYPGPLPPDAVTGRVVGTDTAPAGTFACSDPLVNRLQEAIVWGQRGNFLSIPTDCPQRDERLGWLADAQVFARTATSNRDVAAFFTRWLDDVADAQSAAGAFSDVAPRLIDAADGAPAWGDAGILLPWTLYRVYGDVRILERHYDGMARWLSHLHDANPDLIWRHNRHHDFGDWLAVDADTPKDLLATAYFAHDADLLGRIARLLGRPGAAERHEALFAAIKSAFVAAYVGPDGTLAGDTQTGYALALHMNLLPRDLRAAAIDRLVADVERRGGHLSTGFAGVGLLCPVLTEAGRADVAYRLLQNETFPSWGYMIRRGATTIWERWDGWTEDRGFQDPGMNSFNHYALGAVGEWLYRHVAGIDLDPERPGFEHVIIRPRPGGSLTFAKAEYRSVRGTIASHWRIEDGHVVLEVTVPANTTATVNVPTADPAGVIEGAGPAAEAKEVRYVRADGGGAVFLVGSGRYAFRAPLGHD